MMTVATPYEQIAAALEAAGHPVRNGAARCPAHDDTSPSLSVNEGRDGKVILKCHAGCSTEAVVAALGLTLKDLFPPSTNGHQPQPTVVARYPYTAEDGKLLYTVERYEPGFNGASKSFAQRPANGRRGQGAMDGVRRVLYRLPAVIAAVARSDPVWIVEGEKDVEALERAGCVATCNPGGAGKWRQIVDAAYYLTDASVVIVADKDTTGQAHARDVAQSLTGTAQSIVVVEAEHGKDAADHLVSGTLQSFFVVAGDGFEPALADWLNEPQPTVELEPEVEVEALDEDTWAQIDLGPVLAGEVTQPVPDILIRHDGQALIYEHAINGLHGSSGDGKGWVVCEAIAKQARRGYASILLDYEDIASSITARLLTLGMTRDEILEHLIYIRPQTAATPTEVARIVELIRSRDVRLVVFDSIGEAFAIEGIDEDKDKDVGPWLRAVARPMADAGAAVLIIDHSTKAGDNPLFPSGSKRKRAAITGASYYVEAIVPFVKEQGGRLRLTCAKDRHGWYRRGETAAYLVMECFDSGRMELTLYGPSPTEAKVELAIILAARDAVKSAKKEGRPLSQRALVGAMKIKVGTEGKRAGIELAVARGALSEESGPRNALLYTYATDLPEVPDD